MSAQIIPELFLTILYVIYYSLESLALFLVPKRFRTRKDISNEIVLITGAGHGIGRALSLRFARLGCTVVLVDIDQTWLSETQDFVAEEGGTVYAYVCDVSNRKDVYACAKLIQTEVGNVSILVNNAGIVVAQFLLDLPDEDILRVFRTNCFSHFWTLKAFLPSMMDQNHGHIVTVASIVGKGAGGKASEYISSKFAAVGLHEAMEMELRALRRTGINMTLVCPALVDTGLFEGAEYSIVLDESGKGRQFSHLRRRK
ncbi:Short-chain dehydrogenase/reductase family 16C member 6 [Hypsibius exemplaris]|uniref:Short-chain dehydrogenase/reductase 3 n=1 Tax=Hypsibius exemplaris TaxID=2072580 RepID=A0A9X6NIT3_HYPEX|nr:Short-chain dehydrogenase/reductase family 16C member 6 [Hypsibius exemplaris]